MHVAPPPSQYRLRSTQLEKCSKLLLRKLHTWPKLNRQIILQYFNDYVPSLKVRDFKISKFLTSNFSLQIRSANFACVCSLVLLHICSFQGPRIVHLLESKTELLAFHCCSPGRKRPDLPPGAMTNAVPTANPTFPSPSCFSMFYVLQCNAGAPKKTKKGVTRSYWTRLSTGAAAVIYSGFCPNPFPGLGCWFGAKAQAWQLKA